MLFSSCLRLGNPWHSIWMHLKRSQCERKCVISFVQLSNHWKLQLCSPTMSYLTHGDRQSLNNLLVRHGNNTLPVYFDDSVPDSDAASLGNPASHQTADLTKTHRIRRRLTTFILQPKSPKSNYLALMRSVSDFCLDFCLDSLKTQIGFFRMRQRPLGYVLNMIHIWSRSSDVKILDALQTSLFCVLICTTTTTMANDNDD